MEGILGKKIGMTQLFGEGGIAIPVTIIQAGPCVVVQRKTTRVDGYEAVQLGLVEKRPARKTNKARAGHFKKAGVPPLTRLAEFEVDAGEAPDAGDEVKVTIFRPDDYVDVTGPSKGKGFQGVVKRHGFGGGRATHGSMFHRAPGSIGQSAYPSRVFPGMRGTGRMGGKKATVKNLKVLKVDEVNHLIYVSGSTPGSRNSYVAIRRSKRG